MSATQPRPPAQKSFSKPPKTLHSLGLPLLLVAVLAVILPLVPADTNSLRWHGLKTLAFEVTAAVLLAFWPMSRLSQSADRRLWKGMALVMGVLVLWAWLSHALSPMPDQAFSLHGFWLLASGFIVMGVVASGTQERDGLTILLDSLNAAAIVIGGAAIALYQQDGLPVAEGTFHDHGLLGAALMTLLPMTLASLVSPVSQGRKLLALLAVVVCAAALLLAQTRSSWLGAIVAFLVFGACFLFCRKRAPRQPLGSGEWQRRRFQAIVYSLLAVCALGFFVVSSHQSGMLSHRARTLTTTVLQGHEESVEWRLSTWRGTVRMIEDKPLLGWGAGCYPLHHETYTGAGQPQTLVRSSGPRIQDEAHNSYLQIAAELGVP